MAKKGRRRDLFPLVNKQLSAETSLMLSRSDIIFEPIGSEAFKAMKGLERAKHDKKQVSRLAVDLEPWQIERINEGLEAREKWIGRMERLNGIIKEAMDRDLKEGGLKLPVKFITMTEKCNRHCLHCMVSADMKGMAMPFKDLERYLGGIVRLSPDTAITGGGEPFLYYDDGKDLGDAVKLMLERCRYASIRIVTSGMDMEGGDSPWERAAHKIAGLGDIDKDRVSISLSVRAFASHRMKAARETLKFFIENGICIFPNLEGVTCYKSDGGKLKVSTEERDFMVNDLLAGFGMGKLDGINTGIGCDPIFAYMGNMVANFGAVISSTKEYFGKRQVGKIMIKSWDDRSKTKKDIGKEVCKRMWFGLVPDGTVVPGCCNFSSPFMRLGSVKDATQKNRDCMVRQIIDDRNQFISAQRKWGKKRSCIPCVSWFVKMGKKTDGKIGIRNPEKLRRILPSREDVKMLNLRCHGTVIRQSGKPMLRI